MADEFKLSITDDTAAGAASVEQNLQGIERSADDSQESLDRLAESINTLSDKLTEETRVVHEHTASWTHLGAEAIPALADMVGNVLKYSTELAGLVIRFVDVEKVAKRVINTQEAYNLAKQQSINITAKAVGALTGYAEAVTGVIAIIAAAKGAHLAFNTVLANTGKSADGLTNNLTKTREANAALWDDIKTVAGAGAEAVGDWGAETVANAMRTIDELTGVSDAWKEIDRAVTESTNNYVNNTRVIGESIRGVSREAVAASRAVAKAQAEAADDFERVRMSNEEVAQASKNRAESERLASLDTVEAINAELEAMKQRRGEAAAANKFSEDDQRRYVALVGQLEQRRTEIAKRNSEEREKILKQEADQRAKSDQDYHRRLDAAREEANQKILEEYRQQAREEIQARRDREREVDRFIERERAKILQEEQQKIEAVRRAADERLNILKQEREQRVAMVQNATNADGQNSLDAARGALDPRAVRAEYVRRKQQEAGANFRFEGDDASKVAGERRRAIKQAGIDAFRDFNAGKTSEADIAGAQNSLIQASAQQANSRGQLDNNTLNALNSALQNQQQLTTNQEQQAQQLRQLQAALSQVGGAARNIGSQSRKLGL